MSEIQLFNISGADIRFGTTEDGTPYAVASDYSKAMGYGQASDATRLLDDDEAGQQIVLTRSANGVEQRREMKVIYEDGMWELIFRSKLPGAKAIKKQVKDVLRQIRETGRYEADRPKTGAELVLQMAQELVAHEQRVAVIEQAQAVTAAKVAAIEGQHDWFTALGYAKLHGYPTSRPFLSQVGKDATALMRAAGQEPQPRQDATFGRINTYPVSVLEHAFEGVQA